MLDLIVGKRELGKTTLAISISQAFETVVIFDPRHMIDITSDVLTERNVRGNLYDMLDSRSVIIVRPLFEIEQCFADMCLEIFEWLTDNQDASFCLLLDECRFIPHPETNRQFDFIVRCTPRSRTTVILTCHGITDISTDLRRVADYLIMFRLTLEADLDRVRERCGDTVADIVANLKPYEYVVWDDGKSTFKKHTDFQKWFVPLKKIEVIRNDAIAIA